MKNKFNIKGLTVSVKGKDLSFQGTIDGIALAGTGSLSPALNVDVVTAFEGGFPITDLYELNDLNDAVYELLQESTDFQKWTMTKA